MRPHIPTMLMAAFLVMSVGIAMFSSLGVDADAVLDRADGAMYQAKEAGRNRVRCFDGEP